MKNHRLNQLRPWGLLLLRVGIGAMFMGHGWPKLVGGPESWAGLGGALAPLGIHFAPTFLGFLAAISEFGGGLLLVLGLWTRSASFFLCSTMVIATLMHLSLGDPFGAYSHALESAILFASLILIGPGRYSIDEK